MSKCHKILNLEKINCGELYKIHLFLKYEKPICQANQEKKFGNYSFDWKMIMVYFDIKVNKSYINSALSHVPSVIYMMEHHSTYFMNVFMHKIYATNIGFILHKKNWYNGLYTREPSLVQSMFKIKTISYLIIYF